MCRRCAGDVSAMLEKNTTLLKLDLGREHTVHVYGVEGRVGQGVQASGIGSGWRKEQVS